MSGEEEYSADRDIVLDRYHYKEVVMPWTTDCGECWNNIQEGEPAMVVRGNMDRFRPLHPECLAVCVGLGHEHGCTHWNEYPDSQKSVLVFGDTQEIRAERKRLKEGTRA